MPRSAARRSSGSADERPRRYRSDPVIIRAKRPDEATAGSAGGELILNVYPEGNSCVVHATGELDMASRNQLFMASTAGNHPAMVIDLAGVTFMDCSGYRSLVASRAVLHQTGRSLTIRGQTGQPARLFDLIAASEMGSPQRLHYEVFRDCSPRYQ